MKIKRSIRRRTRMGMRTKRSIRRRTKMGMRTRRMRKEGEGKEC